jgi:hypothetical protein
MIDLAAKNDATNAKVEILSMQYQNLQVGRTHVALDEPPRDRQEQASEVPIEALRSTTIPRENTIAATLQSLEDPESQTKFSKILYPIFDEYGDHDWHIRRFKFIAMTNGVTNQVDLQNILDTLLQENHINRYIDFEIQHLRASWEDMEQSFLQIF